MAAYLLSKLGSLLFRARAAQQNMFRGQQRRPSDGNVNIYSQPGKQKKGGTLKGGDYIDYEEVK